MRVRIRLLKIALETPLYISFLNAAFENIFEDRSADFELGLWSGFIANNSGLITTRNNV